jgi:hypothetical protein
MTLKRSAITPPLGPPAHRFGGTPGACAGACARADRNVGFNDRGTSRVTMAYSRVGGDVDTPFCPTLQANLGQPPTVGRQLKNGAD